MAKMKWGADDVDWKALNDEEYEDNGFEPYDGPVPGDKVILSGQVKKLWLKQSNAGDYMFKVLFEADGNQDNRKVFDGWPCWDNVLFSLPQCKFMWQPFLDSLGITLKDIHARTIIGEEDNVGTVVDKIGKVEFPADIRILTATVKKGEYKGKVEVGRYLEPADINTVDEDDLDEDEAAF